MLYEINEKALKLESEGKKIIRLNLGDPDLATPNEIIEAAYDSMKAGKTKYSSSYGESNFERNSPKSTASKRKRRYYSWFEMGRFRHHVPVAERRRKRHYSQRLTGQLTT